MTELQKKVLFDKENGRLKGIFFNGALIDTDSPLWQLFITDGENELIKSISDMDSFDYNISRDMAELIWKDDQVKVTVTANIRDDDVLFNISAHSLTDRYNINKVIFPIVGPFGNISKNPDENVLLLPWQNGWIIKNPIETIISRSEDIPFWLGRGVNKYENEYPAGYSYQFLSYYCKERYGFYFCAEDGEAYIKTMGFYYDQKTGGMDFRHTAYPENMGKTKDYFMPYSFVLSVFKGDWQVPALKYRKWATGQKWCAQKLCDKELSFNLKNTDLWRINHTDYDLGTRTREFIDTSRLIKEKAEGNLALHWYGWNMGKHDLNYPEYISAQRQKEGWCERLTEYNKELADEGIVKIPYVNGRLWEMKTKSWEDEKALDSAIKNEKSELMLEPWNGYSLKPMCPATAMWHNKVVNFCHKYIQEHGFDGIYVDQIASFNATLCFDEAHPHPRGGGSWWNNSYHSMINRIKQRVGNDKIITTESCCESYIDVFDLFLILDTTMQRSGFHFVMGKEAEAVPLFSLIYGDYALSYGSVCRFSDTPEEFEYNYIRNILWGIIPTIEGVNKEQAEQENSDKLFDIIKKGVKFYKDNKELFLYGRLRAIPECLCEKTKIRWTKGDVIDYTTEIDDVIACVWENKDKDRLLILYNLKDTSAEAVVFGRKYIIEGKSFFVEDLERNEC